MDILVSLGSVGALIAVVIFGNIAGGNLIESKLRRGLTTQNGEGVISVTPGPNAMAADDPKQTCA